jgi:hypothetical protein
VQHGKTIVVNFDNYSESSQGHPKTVILDYPCIKPINKPTTPLVHESTNVKCKRSNVFSPILEILNKSSKVLVDAMEHINVMHLEIEKHGSKI